MTTKEMLEEIKKNPCKMFCMGTNTGVIIASKKDGGYALVDECGQIICDVIVETIKDHYIWKEFTPPIFWFI